MAGLLFSPVCLDGLDGGHIQVPGSLQFKHRVQEKVYRERIRGLSNQGLSLLGDKLLGVRDDGLCRVCRVSILWKERNEPWMREEA